MTIPKIIHKIWFNFNGTPEGETPPEKYIEDEKKCLSVNSEYTIMRWSERVADSFIQKNYPFFYSYFIGYKKKIQKVDALRYFVLYHYGGVYLDMDIECGNALDFSSYNSSQVLLVENNSFVFDPIKFNNFLMASPKGHPFWLHVFKMLIQNYERRWWHIDFWYVLYSTGPWMVTQAYDTYPNKSEIALLKKEEYNPCDPCARCSITKDGFQIRHNYSALWTGQMDGALRIIACYRWWILAVLLIILIIILFVVYIKKFGKKKKWTLLM